MNKNSNFLYISSLAVLLGFFSCDDDDNATQVELEVQMATDIPADPDAERGAPLTYTYFDLDEGEVLSEVDANSTVWDIAIASTSILINGGTSGTGQGSAQIVEDIFEELLVAPDDGYTVDTEEQSAISSEWYEYTGQDGIPINAILTVPGRVIVLTTGDGNYAKLEILSYYKGNPDTSTDEFINFATRPAGRYYTFRYVVQADGSKNF